MNTKAIASIAVVVALMTASVAADAQMPPDVAERVKAIGRVINPKATAEIFAPRVIEGEPYANVKVERDLHYGPADRNLLDVFEPTESSGSLRPVVIFVHGGAFVMGNRRGAGSPFYDNIMLWAARNGMVGVNMTYRLAPQYPWPSGAEDAGLAVKWVSEHIASYGGDAKRVFLFGHSAGATHVADYLANERLQLVRGSGLAGAMVLSGAYQVEPPLAVPAYYGTDPSRFSEESSLRGLLVSKVPMFVGSAEFDPPPFSAQATLLIDSLCKASRCPDSAIFAGHNHMSEPYSIHTDDRAVGDALLKFIRSH